MKKELEVVSVRLVKDGAILSDKAIHGPKDAVKLLGSMMSELDREVVCVINLKADGTPINCNFASMGTLNEAMISPREIFKVSILSNAASMILLHNHPSGSLTPSKLDVQITDRMIQVCSLMEIPLLDHIIVGGTGGKFFSFREADMLEEASTCFETDYKLLHFQNVAVSEMKRGR